MNIFYLHNDPKICAEMHNDKHCIKMILEYAQLLSTAHRVLDGTADQTFWLICVKNIPIVMVKCISVSVMG